MPKKTLDVQVTTLDAVLEFSIDVSASSVCQSGAAQCIRCPVRLVAELIAGDAIFMCTLYLDLFVCVCVCVCGNLK